MRSAECRVEARTTERSAFINSALRIPHSALAIEHRRLFRAPWGRKAEVLVRARRGAAAARGAGQESLLHQERLVHFLERPGVLPYGGGDGGESHRAAVELLDDRLEDPPVHVVEAELRSEEHTSELQSLTK